MFLLKYNDSKKQVIIKCNESFFFGHEILSFMKNQVGKT